MDKLAALFAFLAATMIFVTWQAARLRNARRDAALLATVAGALGTGSLVITL